MSDIATIVLRVVAIFALGFGVRPIAVHGDNVVYPVALLPIGVTVAFVKDVWQTADFSPRYPRLHPPGRTDHAGNALRHAWPVLVVYPVIGGIDRLISDPLSLPYQRVIVRGSLHTVTGGVGTRPFEGMPFCTAGQNG